MSTGAAEPGERGAARPPGERERASAPVLSGPREPPGPGALDARLLAGAGRAREAAAVLAALSGLDAEGEATAAPLAAGVLSDLEELLLAGRPTDGLLILDSARVPDEDIGFVRRFLERHPAWRLLVLGSDEREGRARALRAAVSPAERATALAWPPDLAELRAALGFRSAAAPADAGTSQRPPARRAAAGGRNGAVEVGALVEELLASAALEGEEAPRYQYRAGTPQLVHRDRARLAEGLGGLVALARRCAGSDGVVRATVRADGERVRIGLDFPRGPLSEKELPGALGPSEEDAPGEGMLGPARRAAALLRDLGAELALGPGEPGRLRCDVRLSPEPPAPRASKPEDPFA